MKHLPSSILPKIEPKWKRTITTLEPSSSSNDIKCEVCREENSHYTCPSCLIYYCSVDCYKKHGETCTEVFYKNRVISVMEMEKKTDRERIMNILNRVHEEQTENFGREEVLNQLELKRLRKELDEGKDVELSPELQAAFERDLQSGRLSHIVKSWSPWWESDLLGEEVDEKEASVDNSYILDDRLLEIPPFSKICSKNPPSCLPWNLVSILRAILLVLRLYKGRDNAIICCVDAFETLINSCVVLKDDFRYDSLPEVLMNEADRFLQQDLCSILSNSRHISHALFDGIDIVRAAESELRKKSDRRTARQIRKKLDFYLSWSRSINLSSLVDDLNYWQSEWRLGGPAIEEIRVLK